MIHGKWTCLAYWAETCVNGNFGKCFAALKVEKVNSKRVMHSHSVRTRLALIRPAVQLPVQNPQYEFRSRGGRVCSVCKRKATCCIYQIFQNKVIINLQATGACFPLVLKPVLKVHVFKLRGIFIFYIDFCLYRHINFGPFFFCRYIRSELYVFSFINCECLHLHRSAF